MIINPLFKTYFEYVESTEPPTIFHRWSILSCLGAMLGRQYYLPFGTFNIIPNQYIMLIGDPGTRKSTAIKIAKKLLTATGYNKFSAERTSKEKFLLDLEGIENDDGSITTNSAMSTLFGDDYIGGDPREVFITADEFTDFVGASNMEFLSLLGSLWDWDDVNAPFKQRLKTSRSVSIYQPTINIISGNTHAGFAEAFPPAAIGQGFLSRLVLVYGESSGKKIAFPEPPSDKLKELLTKQLEAIKLAVNGVATMTPQAKGMLQTIYNTFEGLEDVRFKHYSTRRHTHLLKLCLLISASNARTVITVEDVLFSNTLLTYTEHKMPNALGEFGKAKNADVAARVVAVLAEAKEPMDIPAIWKQVQSDLDRVDDLNKIMQNLLQGGKIQYIGKSARNSTIGYLPLKKQLNTRSVYVDYSLLKEVSNQAF